MAELKTKKHEGSVDEFLSRISDEQRRQECREIVKLMKAATGEEPSMWGDSIVGFGTFHYKYASGREGDWFVTGFSPRKQNLTIYLLTGYEGPARLMKKLGKFTHGKSCLYVKKLADIDLSVLSELIRDSLARMAKTGK
ncbi:MAG: DUF1801 domain-containing protein [Candidatus Zixiibacteriota bacterium]